jgi:hypothetical protein
VESTLRETKKLQVGKWFRPENSGKIQSAAAGYERSAENEEQATKWEIHVGLALGGHTDVPNRKASGNEEDQRKSIGKSRTWWQEKRTGPSGDGFCLTDQLSGQRKRRTKQPARIE